VAVEESMAATSEVLLPVMFLSVMFLSVMFVVLVAGFVDDGLALLTR